MNKIEKISIVGYSYSIDRDAQILLEDYLCSLTRKYGAPSENEMVQDIEIRICELLNENLATASDVVTISHVRTIIEQIGSVASIERDSQDTQSGVRFNFDEQPPANRGPEVVQVVTQVLGRGVKEIVRFVAGTFLVLASIALFCELALLLVLVLPITSINLLSIGSFFILPIITVILFTLLICSLLYRLRAMKKNFFTSGWLSLVLFVGVILTSTLCIVRIVDRGVESTFIDSDTIDAFYTTEAKHLVIKIENAQGVVPSLTKEQKFYRDVHDSEIANFLDFDKFSEVYMRVDTRIYDDKDVQGIKVRIRRKAQADSMFELQEKYRALTPDVKLVGDTLYIQKYLKLQVPNNYRYADSDVTVILPSHMSYDIVRD